MQARRRSRHWLVVHTYRALFGVAEFCVLFVNRCLVMTAVAASSLALGTITYGATGSAALTGLAMFGGPLVSLVCSQFLLSGSDSVRPRTALVCQMGGALVADALQLVPGMPWEARFALLAIPYVVNSMFSGTQWVIVREIIPDESFVLARSTMNVAIGVMQVAGYGLGGIALVFLDARGLFAIAAVVDLLCLVNIRLGIRHRPARPRQGGLVRRTREVNRRLLGSPISRPIYLSLWIPNGLVVGCEALFIPYDQSAAGYLFAAGAAGMLLGDVVVGRFVPDDLRDRLITPLRFLLPAPYLAMALAPPAGVVMLLSLVASFGYAASLPLQDRLVRHTDDDIVGQTMGLAGQGMMIGQAVGALLAGAVAAQLSPHAAMALMAATSVLVTASLSPALRRSLPPSRRPSWN